MFKVLVALALTAASQGAGARSEKRAVMDTVQQFVVAFNKGDTQAAAAACADETSIIDEFPPHEWHGQGGCGKWMNDYDADARKNGITDGVVTLASARHLDINGDRAYVVVPANYTYKQKGKVVRETRSILTVALQKSANGWRIAGWAWSKN